ASANAAQLNTDGDSEGDSCDSDDDNDGILDVDEFSFVVDADEDGRTLPFSDGLVFARFAAGLTSNSLTTGLGVAVDETQYSSNLEQNEFDVDGDGTQKYINDGFRLIAALSGVCIENLPSDGNVRTCDEQASYLKPFTKLPPIIQRKWPDSASNSLELVVDVASAASQGLVKVRYKTEGNDPLYGFVLRVFYSSSEVQGLALKDNLLENDSSRVFTFFDDDDGDLDANPATDKVFSYLGFGLFEQRGFSINPKPLILASTSGDAFSLSFDAAANAAFFPYITELPFGYTATNPSSVSGLTFTDSDSDGWGNGFDNCSSIFNPEQDDFDSDSFGNACDSDDDDDGIEDRDEIIAGTNPLASDTDADSFSDKVDNCPLTTNEDQLDTDKDGVGNVCDSDDDGDSVPDASDAFPLDATETVDTDSDGTGNNSDTDDDGDGVPDTADGYALISLGALLDNDSDGFPDNCGEDCLATGMTADSDDDNDGVEDTSDAFPLDVTETVDSDADGVGDNADAFPNDATESLDSDSDSVGDNADNCPSLSNSDQLNTDGDSEGDACDSDDDNDGFTDDQEELDGTNPKSRFSCKSGCFSFDVDENLEAQPLTDGLLVIRHLFGFSGDSLTSGAVSGEAGRDSSEAITGYLTDAVSELDIDGDGESKPLTDGLLLIRYLFGFSGDSLISGAIGTGATRDTADEVEAYIEERVPVQ
ncbi:thrombospondin type 3 repeat-containing protein, partial [Pseudomonadales bacterium]|nr:thrombospondin type 3 repeat-containing protein [Pseudomonadales bacterium]